MTGATVLLEAAVQPGPGSVLENGDANAGAGDASAQHMSLTPRTFMDWACVRIPDQC
jgi:hypothetical protein